MANDATGRESDKFMLRMPDGMRDRLKAEAEANKRSMNAEIVARLESTLEARGGIEASPDRAYFEEALRKTSKKLADQMVEYIMEKKFLSDFYPDLMFSYKRHGTDERKNVVVEVKRSEKSAINAINQIKNTAKRDNIIDIGIVMFDNKYYAFDARSGEVISPQSEPELFDMYQRIMRVDLNKLEYANVDQARVTGAA
ncbi:Arc family DNA-binding protein [Methylobacterium sp. NPDC080182]|uniref:Arc family DNA-binding protein n=1 Tax=Methylobacterium sp. NPDC080182 TaxID=3390590 RepID=UPI003CFC1724